MFTGLIEDLGSVRDLQIAGGGGRITIATVLPMNEIALGDSIAVNGVCLTVVDFGGGQFSADVSAESLSRTLLGELRRGQRVNLERALRLSDRLGGHLVSGHVDGLGKITERRQDHNAVRFTVEIPPPLCRYLVEKGSVAVDGISLTVNRVFEGGFSFAVIPHSLSRTTLQERQVGARVNIETDLLGKYVERLLGTGSGGTERAPLSLDTLAKNGFL